MSIITDYSGLSEEELLGLASEGNAEASSELALRYRPLVKICTRPYFLVGGDSEDLIQEGMIGLLSSIKSFDSRQNCSFRSYAELCIKRRILSAIKSATRNKHFPLNSRLTLEEIYSDDDSTQNVIMDERYNQTPEQLYIKQEELTDLNKLRTTILSALEQRVLELYLDGLSYEEIAKGCGKPVKSVDSALQRIKKKLAEAASHDKL